MNIPGPFLTCTALLFTAGVLHACQICVPFPQTSSADLLLAGEAVVLAREDPERPFRYRTVEVLQGDPGTEKIDLFLNSSLRRMLAVYPKRAIVLVKQSEDGKATWLSNGVADTEFEPLVREILKAAPTWKQAPQERVAFFSKHLGHEHQDIRNLALLEVGRAPYSEIRKLGGVLSREQLHAFLGNYRYLEWHALYILLLAQSEDARDHALISKSFRSTSKFGLTVQLAAWATAAIELEGEKAVAFIESEYFNKTTRSTTELLEIAKALSVQGAHGSPALRDRIVQSYGPLLTLHPGMTAQVAEDLIAWERSEYAAEIGRFVSDNPLSFDFPTTLRLQAYARRADTPKE